MSDQNQNDDARWREQLSPHEYHVCREKGTEQAFTGKYWDHKAKGVYQCRCCGETLFESSAKFDSGTGWPSFFQPAIANMILEQRDASHGMERVEIVCNNCGCHLGHVFPDGPEPTGLRYCVNSASLDFVAENDAS